MFAKIYIWFLIHHLKQWYGFGKISTNVIYAQAKHETGNFTSDIYKENNNLFGMREPKKRKTYATGTSRYHATFKSRFDSIRDYFLRQQNFRIDKTSDEGFIMSTFNSGYAEDTAYLTAWRKHINNQDFTRTQILLMRYGGLIIALLCLLGIYKLVNQDKHELAVKKFTNTHKRLQKYE